MLGRERNKEKEEEVEMKKGRNKVGLKERGRERI